MGSCLIIILTCARGLKSARTEWLARSISDNQQSFFYGLESFPRHHCFYSLLSVYPLLRNCFRDNLDTRDVSVLASFGCAGHTIGHTGYLLDNLLRYHCHLAEIDFKSSRVETILCLYPVVASLSTVVSSSIVCKGSNNSFIFNKNPIKWYEV